MKLLFTISSLLILMGFIMNGNNQQDHPSEAEQRVDSILTKVAGIIKEKYNINPSGSSASMPGGPIQKLGLAFNTKLSLTKEELRILLIGCAQELLTQVNTDEDIQKFLMKRPFTINNIQIIIYNHDKIGRRLYDPDIATAQISQGSLNYLTIDSNDTFKMKNQFEESYEDALKSFKAS